MTDAELAATRDRYGGYADRIAAVSPSYAAWARSAAGDEDLLGHLLTLPPTKRQPELVFAVARRLGADTDASDALAATIRADPARFTAEVARSTMQTNDPRRLASVLPLLGSIPGPIGLVDVGVSAGLCSIPDRITLDLRAGARGGEPGRLIRIATARPGPSVALVADSTGAIPRPVGRIDVVARVGLDPSPLDLRTAGAFDRLVEAVPPEATERVALMRAAALATLADPPELVMGTIPEDLDRALDRLPARCTPVVMTMGTLVYVPGADRQAFVDRVRQAGVRWIAMERTGTLRDVHRTLPDPVALVARGVDIDAPEGFATVSLDGVAVALSDAHGTRVHWL